MVVVVGQGGGTALGVSLCLLSCCRDLHQTDVAQLFCVFKYIQLL